MSAKTVSIACLGIAMMTGAAAASDFTYEVGLKLLGGRASTEQGVFVPIGGKLERGSKLEWTDVGYLSFEVQDTLRHTPTGLRGRGTFGFGQNRGGSLDDEDFVTSDNLEDFDIGLTPGDVGKKFSDTKSDLRKRNVQYWAYDIGWTIPRKFFGIQATPFVGYFHMTDRYMGVGLTTNANDFSNEIDDAVPPGTVVFGPDTRAIGSRFSWKGVEIGVDLQADLNPRSFVALSVGGMPKIGRFRYEDSHFRRTELGSMPNFITTSKSAWSLRLEGVYGYRITPSVTMSVGVRYWMLRSGTGSLVAGPSLPPDQRPTGIGTVRHNRLSGFAGVGYRF